MANNYVSYNIKLIKTDIKCDVRMYIKVTSLKMNLRSAYDVAAIYDDIVQM